MRRKNMKGSPAPPLPFVRRTRSTAALKTVGLKRRFESRLQSQRWNLSLELLRLKPAFSHMRRTRSTAALSAVATSRLCCGSKRWALGEVDKAAEARSTAWE